MLTEPAKVTIYLVQVGKKMIEVILIKLTFYPLVILQQFYMLTLTF